MWISFIPNSEVLKCGDKTMFIADILLVLIICLSSLDPSADLCWTLCFLDNVMCSVLDIVLIFPEGPGKGPMCDDHQITSAL